METVYEYLARLLQTYYPNTEPLSDEMGVCTQIDNMLCGMAAELARLREENAMLHGAEKDSAETIKILREENEHVEKYQP